MKNEYNDHLVFLLGGECLDRGFKSTSECLEYHGFHKETCLPLPDFCLLIDGNWFYIVDLEELYLMLTDVEAWKRSVFDSCCLED